MKLEIIIFGILSAVALIILNILAYKLLQYKKLVNILNTKLKIRETAIRNADILMYEYSPNDKKITFSEEALWQRGLNFKICERIDFIIESDEFGDESKERLKSAFKKIDDGEKIVETTLREKFCSDIEKMRKIIITNFFDKHEKPIKAMVISRDITEECSLLKKAERDGLTGLYNKLTAETMMIKHLCYHKGKNTKNAFIILDIDKFKEMNDTFGHMAGDEILENIAKKIGKACRESDILGRLGGDEFVILMKDIKSESQVISIIQRILNIARYEYSDGKSKIICSISAGVAFGKFQTNDYQNLYRMADMALYKAKQNGRNQYCIYNQEIENL
ncbi:MAG: GGDEF domain-containing protein [Oscillospiraceae bacterium]